MAAKHRIQQLDDPSRVGFDAIFNSAFLEDIPEAIEQWNSQRVLLVASKALASNTDKITALQKVLGPKLVHTKLGVGSHSPYADVQDIALHLQRLDADCVINVGSCSYSDATKIACILAANLDPGFGDKDMEALVDKERGMADMKDGKPLKERTCKLITVPTSLSASEWNSASSSTNPDGKKQHFGLWDRGSPDLILLDPEVASTSPEKLWLSSGVRCVDHCVETMCHPLCGEKGYEGVTKHAEEGLRCMIKGLTEYKQAKTGVDSNGTKAEAERELLLKGISDCQYGSREALTGLLIWRVPMGPSHAIGHQLGSVAGVMHGITSCIMLAPVLRWQAAHQTNPHYKAAQAKILTIFNETLGWHEESASDAISKFVHSLGLPTRLSEVGVTTDEQVRRIAERTLTDVWGGSKRQMEYEDVMAVLESAR